jgi:hypothetical protein
MIIRGILICAIIFFSVFSASAQITDTTVVKTDTTTVLQTDSTLRSETGIVKADTLVKPKSTGPIKDSARLAIEAMPKKALFRSALIPGWGQFYNKGVWWLKVPAIYGGLIAFGIAIHDNQKMYKGFLQEAQYRQVFHERLDPRYKIYEDEGIIQAKNLFRRNRDLSILGVAGVYAVNIIEAYVDAKFFRFDIGDDLSLNISPLIRQSANYFTASHVFPGIKLSLSL